MLSKFNCDDVNDNNNNVTIPEKELPRNETKRLFSLSPKCLNWIVRRGVSKHHRSGGGPSSSNGGMRHGPHPQNGILTTQQSITNTQQA
ncbi:hypothetical protein ACOMHN_014331 [Nucella lapillus]